MKMLNQSFINQKFFRPTCDFSTATLPCFLFLGVVCPLLRETFASTHEKRVSAFGFSPAPGRHCWCHRRIGQQCRCNMCNRVTWNDIGKEQWKTCWHVQCGVNKLSRTLSCQLLSNEHVSLDSSRWIYFWSRVPSTVHMFGRHRWPHPYQDRESRNGCRACQCLKDLHSCEHGHGNGCIESMYCIHSCGIMQIMVLTWRW